MAKQKEFFGGCATAVIGEKPLPIARGSAAMPTR